MVRDSQLLARRLRRSSWGVGLHPQDVLEHCNDVLNVDKASAFNSTVLENVVIVRVEAWC